MLINIEERGWNKGKRRNATTDDKNSCLLACFGHECNTSILPSISGPAARFVCTLKAAASLLCTLHLNWSDLTCWLELRAQTDPFYCMWFAS